MSTSTSTTESLSRPSYSSTVTGSSDAHKRSNARENKFVRQYGSRLHAYGRDKAPYPLSFNREDLELWCLDHALITQAKRSVSFVDFKEGTPKRCLDLGTGLGNWVIDAARHWIDCTFVGFDLVNIQIPLQTVDPSIAKRIKWVHGNFLRIKLPFEDEEFDHIHISGLAFAVPENKWIPLYEELRRVLRTGGTIEQLEEDALFPVLPRWFTEPLHAHARGPSMHFPDGSQSVLQPTPHCKYGGSHEYALLEELFRDVFENRFISPIPSSSLPSYFSAWFGHVLSPPVVAFPMPPLAPLAPLPAELGVPQSTATTPSVTPEILHDGSFLAPPHVDSSLGFALPAGSISTIHPTSNGPGEISVSATSSSSSSHAKSCAPLLERTSSTTTSSSSISKSESHSSGSSKPLTRPSMATVNLHEGSTRMGDHNAAGLLPIDELYLLDEHSLYMQLFRAFGLVMACKEAMWEELMERVSKGDEALRGYGWEVSDYAEVQSRQRFDALVEQYQK
ncbi:hypothetical protein AcV5_004813 [Taiwanofungus camphoratus]|nr:hypothetical protein AcV5_004813 [Antrodia cinnamomea]KAI0961974.1 hypothetical protein AcV7_000928 [Antrodia cinnamomea]